MFAKSTNREISDLISKCSSLGLPEKDCSNAREYLEYNERGLAFDTILTQMLEYDIRIDEAIYRQIESIGKKMSLDAQEYELMAKLIQQ